MKRAVNALSELNRGKRALTVLGLCAAMAIVLPAQTLVTLHSFDGTDGAYPEAALIRGTDGYFYGTTTNSGANGGGTIFKITPAGTLTTLYSFCAQSACADGQEPTAGLLQAANGDLYGTTSRGGATGFGTVFKITPSGTLTSLHSFCSPYEPDCTDGGNPTAGLVQAGSEDLYGTTRSRGAHGHGSIFKITPNGMLTTLYAFCSQASCSDGGNPFAGLVQATNGDFYGTTSAGGTSTDAGTVFKITPAGTLTTLYSFCAQGGPCTDGLSPHAGLIQAADGDLYGTTFEGGANSGGTIFKITPAGALSTVYSFCSQSSCMDGANPEAGLIQAPNRNFYGTTTNSGANGGGAVFKITPSGTLTTLYSFCAQSECTDGRFPYAGLAQTTDGDFYGTTAHGGATGSHCGQGCGTVFSLSVEED
jgi:uncharacterized repeat protein (TIGR03803 family)